MGSGKVSRSKSKPKASRHYTTEQKYKVILADMIEERKDPRNSEYWNFRLDGKIDEWKRIMKELKFL